MVEQVVEEQAVVEEQVVEEQSVKVVEQSVEEQAVVEEQVVVEEQAVVEEQVVDEQSAKLISVNPDSPQEPQGPVGHEILLLTSIDCNLISPVQSLLFNSFFANR